MTNCIIRFITIAVNVFSMKYLSRTLRVLRIWSRSWIRFTKLLNIHFKILKCSLSSSINISVDVWKPIVGHSEIWVFIFQGTFNWLWYLVLCNLIFNFSIIRFTFRKCILWILLENFQRLLNSLIHLVPIIFSIIYIWIKFRYKILIFSIWTSIFILVLNFVLRLTIG